MHLPKISVIVPVYNVEKLLRRCVDSILAQTFTDFELLLINDGSTDGSGDICDEYAAGDPRIRVFHKPNGGVSSARNLGLDNAEGERICFVDSDDYVSPEYLSTLMSRKYADLVVINYCIVRYNDTDFKKERGGTCSYEGDALYNLLKWRGGVNAKLLRAPWGKLMRKCLIDKVKLRFDESLYACEDTMFVLQYGLACRSIEVIDTLLYYYEFSDTNKSTSLSRNDKIYLNHYGVIFGALWSISEQLKSSVGTDDNILFRTYINWIFLKTLSVILRTRQCSILKAFASDINVQRAMSELNLYQVYGRAGTLMLQLIRRGRCRLALLINSIYKIC